MKVVTYSHLRANLAKIMDQAADDHDPVIVTRANGKTAVLLSLEDFGSYEETRYLNASPANAKRLDAAIAEAERGEGLVAVEFDEQAGVFRPIAATRQAAEQLPMAFLTVHFLKDGWADYQDWQAIDRKLLSKLNRLINETARTPFTGSGKPEPLRHDRSGWWSRRITGEHRLVYRVIEDRLEIAQCRYHY